MMIEFVTASQFLKGVDGVAPAADDEIKPGILVPKQNPQAELLVISETAVAVILMSILISSF